MLSSQVSCSRDARVAVVPILFPLDVCLVVPIEVCGHHLIDVGRAISMEAGRSPSACNVDVIRKTLPEFRCTSNYRYCFLDEATIRGPEAGAMSKCCKEWAQVEQRRGRRGTRVDRDVMPPHAMRNTIEKRGLDENCAAHDREVEKPGLVYVTSRQGHVWRTVSRKVSDLCVCGNPADSIAGAWARDSHASLKWGRSMQRKNGGQRGQTSSDGRKRQTSGYGLREGRKLDITRSSEAWRGGGGR